MVVRRRDFSNPKAMFFAECDLQMLHPYSARCLRRTLGPTPLPLNLTSSVSSIKEPKRISLSILSIWAVLSCAFHATAVKDQFLHWGDSYSVQQVTDTVLPFLAMKSSGHVFSATWADLWDEWFIFPTTSFNANSRKYCPPSLGMCWDGLAMGEVLLLVKHALRSATVGDGTSDVSSMFTAISPIFPAMLGSWRWGIPKSRRTARNVMTYLYFRSFYCKYQRKLKWKFDLFKVTEICVYILFNRTTQPKIALAHFISIKKAGLFGSRIQPFFYISWGHTCS